MLDVAVVGAGAIAQQGYLPAVREIPEANLRWVVDIDESRAKEMATTFDASGYATAYDEVADQTDAAIIATPPKFHGEITEAFLREGKHVFVEKPIATTSEDGRELIELADKKGVHYGISRQFREAPATRLLQTFTENGAIGPVERFEVSFGGTTSWDFASDYRVQNSLAGGGVLTDKGPHVLDIAVWLFGDDFVVERYRDDSFGGLEANAQLTVRSESTGITGEFDIAGSRRIDHEFKIVGEDGKIVANPGGDSITLHDFDTGEQTRVEGVEEVPNTYLLRVGMQAKRFVDAVHGNGDSTQSYVPASNGLAVLELVEACYDARELLIEPWEEIGIMLRDEAASGSGSSDTSKPTKEVS